MTNSSKLVTRAQDGDLQAFEELVEIYQNRVFSQCYRLSGSYEDAQDLAQEVFFQAYRSLKSFRQDADLGTWLRKITVNLWINSARRKKVVALSMDDPVPAKNGELVREIAASDESPLERVEREEFSAQVRKALSELAPDFRNVLILREIEGYSYEEIASLIRCSIGTVKSRLSRARRQLLEAIAKIQT